MSLRDFLRVANEMCRDIGTPEFSFDEVEEWVAETVEEVREELRPGEVEVDVLVTDPVDGLATFLFILVAEEPAGPSLWCGVAKRDALDGFFEHVNLGDAEGCLAFLEREATVFRGPHEATV